MRLRAGLTCAGLAAVLTLAPAAVAGPYPPSAELSGEVSPSRIEAGGCATFRGQGFSPETPIVVRDNDDAAGTTTTDEDGVFSKKLCFGVRVKPGRHVLKGTGLAPDGTASPSALRAVLGSAVARADTPQTVTAVLIITGVTETGPVVAPPDAVGLPGDDGPGGLAFTGIPALAMAVLGAALVGVGALLLVAGEQRHRRRRRPA